MNDFAKYYNGDSLFRATIGWLTVAATIFAFYVANY